VGAARRSAGAAALPVGVAVGAGVLGVKAVTGALLHRGPRRRQAPAVPVRPPRGSVAGRWFEQAERAVTALDDMADTAPPGPTGTAVRSAATAPTTRCWRSGRVGAQVTAVESALGRVEDPRLDAEAFRLSELARRAPTAELRQEVERSARSVRDRIEVRDRLRGARDTLLARMQSVTLGLEGPGGAARRGAGAGRDHGGSDDAARDLADIAAELDGLRSGWPRARRCRGACSPPPRPTRRPEAPRPGPFGRKAGTHAADACRQRSATTVGARPRERPA
jgi:hypothetical protein